MKADTVSWNRPRLLSSTYLSFYVFKMHPYIHEESDF
jgi:hypothetical protein